MESSVHRGVVELTTRSAVQRVDGIFHVVYSHTTCCIGEIVGNDVRTALPSAVPPAEPVKARVSHSMIPSSHQTTPVCLPTQQPGKRQEKEVGRGTPPPPPPLWGSTQIDKGAYLGPIKRRFSTIVELGSKRKAMGDRDTPSHGLFVSDLPSDITEKVRRTMVVLVLLLMPGCAIALTKRGGEYLRERSSRASRGVCVWHNNNEHL